MAGHGVVLLAAGRLAAGPIAPGSWHRLQLNLTGAELRASVDGADLDLGLGRAAPLVGPAERGAVTVLWGAGGQVGGGERR